MKTIVWKPLMIKIQRWLKTFAVFWYVQIYCSWPKQFKRWNEVLTMVRNVIVVGTLTCCTLLLSAWSHIEECAILPNLGTCSLQVWRRLQCRRSNQKVKVPLSIVTRWLKKFQLSFKNLNNQARWTMPKTEDSESIFQAILAIWFDFIPYQPW